MPPDLHRFSIFMPSIDFEKGVPYDIHSCQSVLKRGFDDYSGIPIDTVYYNINTDEWYQLLKKKASKKDILSLLYHTSPQDYYDDKKDILAQNSFYKTLQLPDYQEEKVYLDFAKACESVYSTQGGYIRWGDEINIAKLTYLLQQGESLLPLAKKPFVRLRLAYLTIKLCDYLENKEKALAIYEKYMKNSPLKSWVKASVMYHLGKVTDDARFFFQAFMKSCDKRNSTLQTSSYWGNDDGDWKPQEDRKKHFLKFAKTDDERTAIHCFYAWYQAGRSLENLEIFYALDPTNKDIPLLITREIQNFDQNVLFYKIDNFKESITTRSNQQLEFEIHSTLRYHNDLEYLAKFRQFISKVLTEKKAQNLDFIKVGAAHLAFTAQNYSAAKKYLKNLKTSDNQILIQKKFLNYLIKIKEKKQDNLESDNGTVALFEFLKTNEKNIAHYKEVKQHLVDFIASDYIKNKSVAKGILLSFHRRDSVAILAEGVREPYHLLLNIGKPEDYENILEIVHKNPQKRTFFEKFLFQSGMGYYGEYHDSYMVEVEEKSDRWIQKFHTQSEMDSLWLLTMQIDTCRILDYKGMYYLNREDFANTYATYCRIPNNYWERYSYKTCINNPFKGAKHSKKDYIKGLIDTEIALDTATVTKGYLYALLAHAHFNMSYHGNSWLMRNAMQSNYENDYDKYESYPKEIDIKEYYGNEKAFFYFKKAYESTNNDDLKSSIAYQLEKLFYSKGNTPTFWRNQPHEIGRNCGIELEYEYWHKP